MAYRHDDRGDIVMIKYYKAEDVAYKIAKQKRFEAVIDSDYAPTDIEPYITEATAFLIDMPTIEVSEDAISREWAINKQKELIELYTPHKTVEGRGQVYWQIEERKLVAKELEHAPSVLPKRSCYRCGLREDCEDSTERKLKEGEWIETPEGTMCGNCRKFPYDDGEYHIANWHSDYCPNCGAMMKGERG